MNEMSYEVRYSTKCVFNKRKYTGLSYDFPTANKNVSGNRCRNYAQTDKNVSLKMCNLSVLN